MPDAYYLRGPQGTTLNLASFIDSGAGPDFDPGYLDNAYAESAYFDGGEFAFQTARLRRMKFPMILASNGAFGGLETLEQMLRQVARDGATLDLAPNGVASDQALRWDVVGGRLVSDYSIPIQRVARRRATLELDCQPFGYIPTWILLASAASVGIPGVLAVPGGSVIGDVPAFARLHIQPSIPLIGSGVPSTLPTFMADVIAWSLAPRPSHPAFLLGASWVANGPSSAINNDPVHMFPGATGIALYTATGAPSWTGMAVYDVPTALEPALRGRHRVFAYLRPQMNLPTGQQYLIDVAPGGNPSAPMASAQPVATVSPAFPSVSGLAGHASAFTMLVADMGELALPAVASGAAQALRLRLWALPASRGDTIQQHMFGGISLVPVDGPAGILTAGLAWPSRELPSAGRLTLDAYDRAALVAPVSLDLATTNPVRDAQAFHRGDLPYVSASTSALAISGAARRATAATAYTPRIQQMHAAVAVQYRPRFLGIVKAGV